ncbi:MAG: acyl-CoA reductase, partial [Myxococcota bacterium]
MTAYRDAPRHPVSETAQRLRRAAPALRDVDEREAAEALAQVATTLRRDEGLVPSLAASTGLSPAGVRWALDAATRAIDVEVLLSMRRRTGIVFMGRVNSAGLSAVVLAGNVFTAALRAMLLPLLLQVPVLVRCSRRERVLPEALAAALPPPFDAACAVVDFSPEDEAACRAFTEHVDVLHVYGSDATVLRWRALAPAGAAFVPHGHGVGAAVVPSFATDLERAAEGLALDVAAYDQRGCLSPVRVLVEGDAGRADALAEALGAALARQEARMPRGPGDAAARAAEARWRATAAALAAHLV